MSIRLSELEVEAPEPPTIIAVNARIKLTLLTAEFISHLLRIEVLEDLLFIFLRKHGSYTHVA